MRPRLALEFGDVVERERFEVLNLYASVVTLLSGGRVCYLGRYGMNLMRYMNGEIICVVQSSPLTPTRKHLE